MRVEGVESVSILYTNGEEETYLKPSVKLRKTEIGNRTDKDYTPGLVYIDITLDVKNIVEKGQEDAV